MKTLPVRVWLLILSVAVVAVPAMATAAILVLEGPLPADPDRATREIAPALRAEIAANPGLWADPVWQAGLQDRLNAAGLAALLVDGSGRVVLQSAGWTAGDAAGSAEGWMTLALPAQGEPAAAAFLRPVSQAPLEPPGPPRFDSVFWRIPLAQMLALLSIVGAIAIFMNLAFLTPLSRMVDGMRRIGRGDLDVRLPRSRVTEVDEVATAFDGMADALRAALERQEQLEQDRRMTISAVVHDLRTPLISLRGYLAGLDEGLADTPEKAARYVKVCREKADALERLVSDLFEYTRTECLDEASHRELIDFSELLRHTVEGMQPQAAAKGLRLRYEGAGEPLEVSGDPRRGECP